MKEILAPVKLMEKLLPTNEQLKYKGDAGVEGWGGERERFGQCIKTQSLQNNWTAYLLPVMNAVLLTPVQVLCNINVIMHCSITTDDSLTFSVIFTFLLMLSCP